MTKFIYNNEVFLYVGYHLIILTLREVHYLVREVEHKKKH